MITGNLESFIAKDGKHAIFTGTFNPPHIGHSAAINESFRQLPYLTSIIVIPHSWNTKKSPPVEIGTRVRWLTETFQEFIPDLSSRIVVCFDPLINERPVKFDELCNTYKFRMHRIVGSDKQSVLIRGKNQAKVLQTRRLDNIDSTVIRNSINEGNINRIREMLSKSVLDDILENHYYN